MSQPASVSEARVLDVGCGNRKTGPGVVRLDISTAVNPDVVWDLDQFPYPFESSSFTGIDCMDVIEHISNIPKVIEEFYRLLKPGGILKITTPHYSCSNSYVDPTHRWHLSAFSFDFFCRHKLYYFSNAKFDLKRRHIQFNGGRFSRSIVSRVANKYPELYEQRLAWLWPAWYLYFELEAVK